MAFELSSILIPLIASSVVVALKEKHSLINFEAIVTTLECFLYLTIAFKVGWPIFSDNRSKYSNFRILRLIKLHHLRKNRSVSLQLLNLLLGCHLLQ